MSPIRTSLALASLLLSSGVSSQPAPAGASPGLDGKWAVSWSTEKAGPYSATLDLQNGAGTFQRQLRVNTGGLTDPCLKLAAPTAVSREGDSFVVRAKYSQALTGCQDLVMRFPAQAGAGTSHEGTMGRSRNPVSLNRP
jgi:hypothetical protein